MESNEFASFVFGVTRLQDNNPGFRGAHIDFVLFLFQTPGLQKPLNVWIL